MIFKRKLKWCSLGMHQAVLEPVKMKHPAVAVEMDRRQPKVALENVIRLRLITDSTRRWETVMIQLLTLLELCS